MAKNGSNDGKKGAPEDKDDAAAGWNMDAMSEALRDAGRRAADLAQNPYARSLMAAGLVAAAAALASNKNVREATRRNLRTATEAAEVAADNAGKIGVAIINAATEAVQRMMSATGDVAGAAAGAATAKAKQTESAPPAPAPARKRRAPKSAGASETPKPRKPRTAKAAGAGKANPASASKPAAKAAAKPRAKTGGTTRKPAAKKSS